jgi:bifunctional N-acetylglucosamine-1-phosphate-uridyltransferase/glucosamine-1-phosphate-acetyltransferase GlmU-like protein
MKDLEVILLAAGKGNRMNSDLPKPLYKVGNQTSIEKIVKNILAFTDDPIVVIGNDSKKIIDTLGKKFTYVIQEKQQGTGDAVRAVKKSLKNREFAKDTIVLLADMPFISQDTLKNIHNIHKQNNSILTLGTITVPSFSGDYELFFHYGRIIRDENNAIKEIIEEKDASENEKNIKETNVSYYCFNTNWLFENIDLLENNNKSGEFYLTDMVKIAKNQNISIYSYNIPNIKEGMGFNTQEQLKLIQKLAEEE